MITISIAADARTVTLKDIDFENKPLPNALVLDKRSDTNETPYDNQLFELRVHTWPEEKGAVVNYRALSANRFVTDTTNMDILAADAARAGKNQRFELSGPRNNEYVYMRSREDDNYVAYRNKVDGYRVLRGAAFKKGDYARFKLHYIEEVVIVSETDDEAGASE